MDPKYLFSETDWHSQSRRFNEKMENEIRNLGANSILSSPMEDLLNYFEKSYSLEVPTLQKDHIVADQCEREIDVSYQWARGWDRPEPHYVRGTEISITVPFVGEAEFFSVRPTTYSSVSPTAEIREQALIMRVIGTQLDGTSVRKQFDAEIAQIEGYLSNLRNSVEPYNRGIRDSVRKQIEARRGKLLADQNLVSSLGFPLRERTDSPRTFVPPEVRRKIRHFLPPTSSQPFKPEPALSDDDYEHILGVLQNMALVMEKSPSAFESIDEESLRSHFLVQLNGHYEGQATGETFNYQGKTDVLLPVDGGNIFVAECKYWDGGKKLKETIDQLLGYCRWRDSKTALIIFNRRKNFSSVLSAIPSALQQYPNFKRLVSQSGDTRFRAIFSHKDDIAREIIVTILAFDVPIQIDAASAASQVESV